MNIYNIINNFTWIRATDILEQLLVTVLSTVFVWFDASIEKNCKIQLYQFLIFFLVFNSSFLINDKFQQYNFMLLA